VKNKWYEITANKVLAFALICVAVSSGFVMYMQWMLIETLSAPEWCVRAINAEKLSSVRATTEFGSCANLLVEQVQALATALYINAAVPALCLLVLMVIVVAGGQLKFKVGKGGIEGDISKEAKEAATDVANAAVERKDEIVNEEETP
jgi:hypothetical protein